MTVRVSPWNQAAQGHASASAVKAFLKKAHAVDYDQQIVPLGKKYFGLENHDADRAWT